MSKTWSSILLVRPRRCVFSPRPTAPAGDVREAWPSFTGSFGAASSNIALSPQASASLASESLTVASISPPSGVRAIECRKCGSKGQCIITTENAPSPPAFTLDCQREQCGSVLVTQSGQLLPNMSHEAAGAGARENNEFGLWEASNSYRDMCFALTFMAHILDGYVARKRRLPKNL